MFSTCENIFKIGCSLKKRVNIHRRDMLRRKGKGLEDVANFEKLLVSEWSYPVLHHSLSTHTTKKSNKVEVLPFANDLERLRKSVLLKTPSSTEVLIQQPQLLSWSRTPGVSLPRLLQQNLLCSTKGGGVTSLKDQSGHRLRVLIYCHLWVVLKESFESKWQVDGLDCSVTYICL